MKKLLIISILLLVIISGCTSNKKEKDNIDKMLDEMSLEEKIGQMMIIFYRSDKMDSTLKKSLDTVKPGGFILFSENFSNYDNSIKLIKEIKETSKIPMFISIDEEGGRVQRLLALKEEVSNVPSMYDVGKMGDLNLTEGVGRVIGEELRVFGINLDFAPVLDIYENKDNTVIGNRSFGEDKETVSKQALAFANGLSRTGVIPVYKHFPGHGNTSVDSHYELPVVTKTKNELLNDELVPFKDAIDNGAEIIMIGHLAVPKITGDNTPASLSRKLITDLLKDELGYKGLVITDALNMGALTNNYTQDEVYVKAINAGVDILLMPPGSINALESIKKSVESGLISEDTINKSVRKILELKYNKSSVVKEYDKYLDKSYLNSDEHKEILNKIKK